MIGYLKPDINEFKVKELKLYNAYYCGICTSMAKRYGFVSRFLLSYDSTFFVILSDALSGSKGEFTRARCPLPPFQKKRVIRDVSVDFGTEISKFFSDLKIDDFKRDSRGIKHFLSFFLFHFKSNEEFIKTTKTYTDKILFAELSEESNSQDVADLFGKFSSAMALSLPDLKKASNMIYLIGKWIYLIDALDDLEKDFGKKNYNPFLVKYRSDFDDPAFFAKIREKEKPSVQFLLSRVQEEYGEIKSGMSLNQTLIENVVFYGMDGVSKKVLEKKLVKN